MELNIKGNGWRVMEGWEKTRHGCGRHSWW
jgi:hypothetical protein